MMRRALIALLLLAASLAPAVAGGNSLLAVRHVAPIALTVSTCPNGTSLPDGCPGANPASVFQVASAFSHGGLFNTLAGTTTDYSTTNIGTAGVNAAGVAYPVGHFTATASLLDPAPTSGGSPIAGCTQSTTGAGNPLLTCSGASFVGFSGYDFSARFGHACVVVTATANDNNAVVWNNNFKNDGNCGHGNGQESMVNITSVYPFTSSVMYNSFDGMGTSFPYNTCSVTPAIDGTCNGAAALNASGINTIEYNAFIDFAARPLYCNSTNVTDIYTLRYNYIQGWDYHAFNGHTEFVVCNGNSTITQDYEYNTVAQTTDAMQFGPVPIFAASTWPMDIGSITVVGNTVISSLVGGSTATATVSGCVGATMSGGVCSGPGTNFFASSVSGTDRIGHGEGLGGAQGGPVCTTPSGTLTVTSITAPSGGTSTMTVTGSPTVGLGISAATSITMSSGYGTNPMTITKTLTGIGAAGTYTVTNTNTGSFSGSATATAAGVSVSAWLDANIGGGQGSGSSWTIESNFEPSTRWLAGPATCSGLLMFGASQNVALFEANGFRHVGSANMSGNYIDSTSTYIFSHSGASIGWGGSGQGPFTASIASGAMTITTSQNLVVGEYVIGASVPGCTVDPTTCPTVVSGSGTSWTVTPAISAPSESMTAERPVVCGIPAVVSSNADMAGLASGAVLNPNFSTASFSHGC